MCECILIDFLQKADPEDVLDGEGTADHALGKVVQRMPIWVHRRVSVGICVKILLPGVGLDRIAEGLTQMHTEAR